MCFDGAEFAWPGFATIPQVSALQREQQQLLSALSALEGSLLEARQATDEQRAACARAEEAAQRKAAAVSEARQELREAKQQTQQVGGLQPVHVQRWQLVVACKTNTGGARFVFHVSSQTVQILVLLMPALF
jgi:hypothetical protein